MLVTSSKMKKKSTWMLRVDVFIIGITFVSIVICKIIVDNVNSKSTQNMNNNLIIGVLVNGINPTN
jgi:hypothetical protein